MSIKYPSQLLKIEQELQSFLTITKQTKQQQKKQKTQSKSDNQQFITKQSILTITKRTK